MGSAKKKISLNCFFLGLHKPDAILCTQPFSNTHSFNGVVITLSFEGVYQLLKSPILHFTNKVLSLESLLGNDSESLLKSISNAKNNVDRTKILDVFFTNLYASKKK